MHPFLLVSHARAYGDLHSLRLCHYKTAMIAEPIFAFSFSITPVRESKDFLQYCAGFVHCESNICMQVFAGETKRVGSLS